MVTMQYCKRHNSVSMQRHRGLLPSVGMSGSRIRIPLITASMVRLVPALLLGRNWPAVRVRAIALQENDFRGVTLPAIVHWEFDHFIIVERWSPTQVEVVDPDRGRRRLPAEEFDEGFTGIVLMLEPGEHFDRRTSTSEITLRTYLVRYLKQAPLVFVQIIAATLLLEFLGLGVPVFTEVVVDQVIPHQM